MKKLLITAVLALVVSNVAQSKESIVKEYCTIERARAVILTKMRQEGASITDVMKKPVIQQNPHLVEITNKVFRDAITPEEIEQECLESYDESK